ncbi:extracellular solute-binding protein [Edaphobacter aggregans]|uniref:extracellular solute-binding protein n=1 Tax=Edaphobacter aggregans TaxID=570835 RepID=UPI001470814D|nr:extracellular solute-binding protein [Edaphobacter aggregans]
MNIRGSAHRPLQNTLTFIIVLLFCIISGCRKPAPAPVTVTFLDQEWSQPDELSRAERESREFTRETGIAIQHPPVPETLFSALPQQAQLDLLRRLLQEGGPSPDVLGIDVIWPGILADHLMDLRPDFATELSSQDPQLVSSYTVHGKVVAVPYHAHVGVLAFRTDLLRQYGYSHPPETWDELEGMAARIQAGERTRIARELHDSLLQSLHGLMFEFQAARNMFPKRPEEALQALDGALMGTEWAITESQDAIENLRGTETPERDLAQLVKMVGENLVASRHSDHDSPAFGLTVEGQQRELTPVIRDEIYCIAREVLRNAFRHAQARRIETEILYDEDQFRLRVRDDGKGMDPQVLEKGSRPGHWGLRGVRERAQQIGAKLDVWSQAGAGTEVQLAVAASVAYQKTSGRSGFGWFQRTGNHERRP